MISDKVATPSPRAVSLSEKGGANVRVAPADAPVELERRFSFLACLGLGFSLLNSWTGEYRRPTRLHPSIRLHPGPG